MRFSHRVSLIAPERDRVLPTPTVTYTVYLVVYVSGTLILLSTFEFLPLFQSYRPLSSESSLPFRNSIQLELPVRFLWLEVGLSLPFETHPKCVWYKLETLVFWFREVRSFTLRNFLSFSPGQRLVLSLLTLSALLSTDFEPRPYFHSTVYPLYKSCIVVVLIDVLLTHSLFLSKTHLFDLHPTKPSPYVLYYLPLDQSSTERYSTL